MDSSEFQHKLTAIKDLLGANRLEAILIRRVPNFAWVTCGASGYVNTATEESAASLLISSEGQFLIANNIEAPRLEQEERLATQGWEFHIDDWYADSKTIEQLTRGQRVGSDMPYPGAMNLGDAFPRLRMNLHSEEQARIRAVGRSCADAMEHASRSIKPGMTEHEIAAMLGEEVLRRGVVPIVTLVATDERVSAFRHPLPTSKTLERYALLALCGRQGGLVVSVSRLIHFGRLPDELRRRAEATAKVDAALIETTRPGVPMKQVFRAGIDAYAQAGFPDEWRLHHQGGPVGYEPRELLVSEATEDMVRVGQAYAWNPTITGTKSEDTILVGPEKAENLTVMPGWPVTEASHGGRTLSRPAVLEID